jgi:hypothetical protein
MKILLKNFKLFFKPILVLFDSREICWQLTAFRSKDGRSTLLLNVDNCQKLYPRGNLKLPRLMLVGIQNMSYCCCTVVL